MHARDRHAAIAAIDGLAQILRKELGETAQAGWPILSVLLRNHLNDRQTTVTALADHSGLPRSSARRSIFSLKAQGWLEMRPLSKHSSRAEVKPSVMLLDKLDKVTEQTIRLLVGAVDTQALDRFNATSLAPATDVAWPRPAASGFNDALELTLLAYADPVFEIIKQNHADLERFLGMRLAIQMCPQDDYRAELGAALARDTSADPSAPMLVAIPFPWLAKLSADGRLLDLQGLQSGSRISGFDFYDAVWRAGWSEGHLYGIPIQPTLDFLWYRQDLFDAEGLQPPRCFDDVVECARRLHRPSRGRVGITWCAAPGLPLGETFLQILGAQGELPVATGVPRVDTDAGRRVIEYLRALIPYSPTDLRSLQWVRSAQIFGRGQAAMGYHWSNRYGVLDSHILLQKGARVGLLPHPTFTPDIAPVTPLGGALLAIPASGNEAARQAAWRAVETLTSAELMKYFVMQGAAGNARFSVAEDRYVLQRNRVVGVMDQLAKAGQIQAFPSPAAVHYQALTRVLSDHLESLLFDGSKDIAQGLAQMQRALERIEGLTGERAAKRTQRTKGRTRTA